jgi:hypothetical protein
VLDGGEVSGPRLDPHLGAAVAAVAFAHGWTVAAAERRDATGHAHLRLRPVTP